MRKIVFILILISSFTQLFAAKVQGASLDTTHNELSENSASNIDVARLKEAQVFKLSDSVEGVGKKVEYYFDKDFIRSIRTNSVLDKGFVPFYCDEAKGSSTVSIQLKNELTSWDAAITFHKERINNAYQITIGKVTFLISKKDNGVLTLSVNGGEENIVYDNGKISYHADINIFRVITHEGYTNAYFNGKLVLKTDNHVSILKSIRIETENICANGSKSCSDKLYDVRIAELKNRWER